MRILLRRRRSIPHYFFVSSISYICGTVSDRVINIYGPHYAGARDEVSCTEAPLYHSFNFNIHSYFIEIMKERPTFFSVLEFRIFSSKIL